MWGSRKERGEVRSDWLSLWYFKPVALAFLSLSVYLNNSEGTGCKSSVSQHWLVCSGVTWKEEGVADHLSLTLCRCLPPQVRAHRYLDHAAGSRSIHLWGLPFTSWLTLLHPPSSSLWLGPPSTIYLFSIALAHICSLAYHHLSECFQAVWGLRADRLAFPQEENAVGMKRWTASPFCTLQWKGFAFGVPHNH